MEPIEAILIASIGGGILIALATIIVVFWRKTHISWKPFSGRPGMFYCFEKTGSSEKLSIAVSVAVDSLVIYTKWSRADIERAIADLHIHVKGSEHWMEDTGDARGSFKTAGLQQDDGVRVGPSLAALCHEIAHRVGQVIDGNQYVNHEGWAGMGIYAAIEDYLSRMG
jgi:hypothetical protein